MNDNSYDTDSTESEESSLSGGALLNILRGEQGLQPVLQVLGMEVMLNDKLRLKVSDGLFWHYAVVPHTAFNNKREINLSRIVNCLVRIGRYTVHKERKQIFLLGEQDVHILMCSEITVLSLRWDDLGKIGEPKFLCDSLEYLDLKPHHYFNPSASPGARIRAQKHKLSEWSLRTMMTNQNRQQSCVLQILRKTYLSIDRDIQRCNLLLSDGIYYKDAVLLSYKLTDETFNNSLENYAIIRVSKYSVINSFNRREMCLFDVEVVAAANEVEQLIGYPIPLPAKFSGEPFYVSTRFTTRTGALFQRAATPAPARPTDDEPVTKRKRTTGTSVPRRTRGQRRPLEEPEDPGRHPVSAWPYWGPTSDLSPLLLPWEHFDEEDRRNTGTGRM